MKTRLILLGSLLVLCSAGAWAQDSRIVDYTKKLADYFAGDGITVLTGKATDGTQNLAVLANRGYFPLQYTAKAGIPSVLRVYTDRTFDCSRAFYLPDLKKQAVLESKGVATFPIPPMAKGATLFGTCGMGMYTFTIRFE